eukprot:scaffold2373_cov239-Pinguiococcus_pyrenoidosus.AAC.10
MARGSTVEWPEAPLWNGSRLHCGMARGSTVEWPEALCQPRSILTSGRYCPPTSSAVVGFLCPPLLVHSRHHHDHTTRQLDPTARSLSRALLVSQQRVDRSLHAVVVLRERADRSFPLESHAHNHLHVFLRRRGRRRRRRRSSHDRPAAVAPVGSADELLAPGVGALAAPAHPMSPAREAAEVRVARQVHRPRGAEHHLERAHDPHDRLRDAELVQAQGVAAIRAAGQNAADAGDHGLQAAAEHELRRQQIREALLAEVQAEAAQQPRLQLGRARVVQHHEREDHAVGPGAHFAKRAELQHGRRLERHADGAAQQHKSAELARAQLALKRARHVAEHQPHDQLSGGAKGQLRGHEAPQLAAGQPGEAQLKGPRRHVREVREHGGAHGDEQQSLGHGRVEEAGQAHFERGSEASLDDSSCGALWVSAETALRKLWHGWISRCLEQNSKLEPFGRTCGRESPVLSCRPMRAIGIASLEFSQCPMNVRKL